MEMIQCFQQCADLSDGIFLRHREDGTWYGGMAKRKITKLVLLTHERAKGLPLSVGPSLRYREWNICLGHGQLKELYHRGQRYWVFKDEICVL